MAIQPQEVVLQIRILNAQGQFLGGTADLECRSGTASPVVLRGQDASKDIPVSGLPRSADAQVTVTPTAPASLAPQTKAVSAPASGIASLSFVFAPAATLAAVGPLEINLTPPEIYSVQGTVSSPDRAGVSNLSVQIFDNDIASAVLLAETTTDGQGAYSVQFQAPSLSQRHKAQPDLQAKALLGKTLLGASVVRYNASTEEQLDIRLPANSTVLPSEHESLTGAVSAVYTGALRDLKESADRQDISYLANKTGWDARAVALAALADQFSQASAMPAAASSTAVTAGAGSSTVAATGNAFTVNIAPIPAPFYYALFRAGISANQSTLHQTDIGVTTAIWNQAISQGVIPASLAAAIPAAAKRFQTLGAQSMLGAAAFAGVSPLKDLLAASGLTSAQQQQFADLYSATRGDLTAFWTQAGTSFGKDTANRLQVDGKLALLTVNNAPLMQALHKTTGAAGISDPIQLAQAGYHRASKWTPLLAGIQVPPEIPGDTPQAQQANYADFLAAQVRLSYPTASIAEQVHTLAVDSQEAVAAFLTAHQDDFEIGMQPVEQYVNRKNVPIANDVKAQIKRIQRAYQITPSDQAMAGLLSRGIDSAYHVARYSKDAFVRTFAQDLGGADAATQVYDKSVQVHHAVLNVAVSFMTARNGMSLGAQPLKPAPAGGANPGLVLNPAPTPPAAANAGDVLAYPTLDQLFGSMDFCACPECRSVLSPAAYLVDLLMFTDQPAPPPNTSNPQTVLLSRRPDLQHLPLTCENTNTAMPYIDLINETLEYFVVQGLSLQGYTGHDTNGSATEDLLASPQFVMDAAYVKLRQERFPLELPFHQPLENLRRYFDKFQVSLPLAMERFRTGDGLTQSPYGWRDILLEELRISLDEYQILTDSAAVPLAAMYGFVSGTSDSAAIAALSNAKSFAQRLDTSYDDIAALLGTRFINPNCDLIPKLQRLGVDFAMLAELKAKNDAVTDQKFDNMLPAGAGALDPAEFGGDIKAWVKNDANFARIMSLIILTDPTSNSDPCNFDNVEFRYSKPVSGPTDISTRLGAAEYTRLLRFIRLWRKTGWTIEQTDAAICSLFRSDLQPLSAADVDSQAKLDAGFINLLPRLGVLARVLDALELTADRDLLPLLACWTPLGTQGANALYRKFFLNPALLKQDPVFAQNPYGEFLADNAKKLVDHAAALRSAFSLTGDEYDRIVGALGFDGNTTLSIPNISAIHRRGYLARKLHISVRELLLLMQYTGLDPFAAPDLTNPAISQLTALVQQLKAQSLGTAAALYLIWNQDLSGKSAPTEVQLTELARTLRGDFAAIDDQFAVTEDPSGDIARARLALVYGTDAATAFFALLDNTLVLDTAYTHPNAQLDAPITAAGPNIAYDDFRHRLSYTGVMTAAQRDALKAVAGVSLLFQQAVDALFARSEDAKGSFFARFPELQPLYAAYVASANPPDQKRTALLQAFQPTLSAERKRQQAVQRLSAAAGLDVAAAQILLDPASPPYPLHAEGQPGRPVLDDVVALGTMGLAAQIFYSATATGAPAMLIAAAGNLDYSSTNGNPLPQNPAAGASVSLIFSGLVEIPEAGFYNFVVDADAGAAVKLSLNGAAVPLVQNGAIWRNTNPLDLKAGELVVYSLTVENVISSLRIQWENPKRPRAMIPGRYLYPAGVFPPFTDAYTRFLKAASLASGLSLTSGEMAHFATDTSYLVNGDGWLNALAVTGDPAQAVAVALRRPLEALLDFARIKADLSPADESLLAVLQDPVSATLTPTSLLFTLTRWNSLSLQDALSRFGATAAGLAGFDLFRRVYDGFALVQTMGIRAQSLIQASTNNPDASLVRDFQSALIARYDPADWRDAVQPINDAMRGLQRDALVAFILHQMRSNPQTAHIDTPDKLFEYFLMDVQMEPCMQTSRIRNALSSVQLFIERCIMNLEANISPASFNAQQWEWMKRYRVWEANRKVFLFPENWLEPELRDDKSPFYKDLESELGQGDITDDSASTALLNYLTKLEEVAKLQPCGICHVEADAALRTGAVDHVIARTAGANRKYFYRRLEYGYWTPWEEVKLDIDDNPVIPVIWNDRLLLFWLKLMKKAPLEGPTQAKPRPKSKPPTLAQMHLNDLKSDADKETRNKAQVTMQASLCWSEYYNGKWQPAKTSDVTLPTTLMNVQEGELVASFRNSLTLSVAQRNDVLRVSLDYAGGSRSSFLLYNTHSLPVRQEDQPAAEKFTPPPADIREILLHHSNLGASYYSNPYPEPSGRTGYKTVLRRGLLKPPLAWKIVEPHHALAKPHDAPFFYEDSRHTFYVTSAEERVLIRNHRDYGVVVNPKPIDVVEIPPLVLQPGPQVAGLKFWGDGGPVGLDAGVIDTTPIQQFITEDAYIRQGLGSAGGVSYGSVQIGPSGAVANVGE